MARIPPQFTKKATKVDPRTGKPDDRKGRDPRGGPADDVAMSAAMKKCVASGKSYAQCMKSTGGR